MIDLYFLQRTYRVKLGLHSRDYGTDVNYRFVWARDGSMTLLWTSELEDEDIHQRNVGAVSDQAPIDRAGPPGIGGPCRLCQTGVEREWEFNEWYHGVPGRPMGKAFQAGRAAGRPFPQPG